MNVFTNSYSNDADPEGTGGEMSEWVVLLEAARHGPCGPIDAGDVRRLHEALHPGPDGGLLYSPDRYALQLTTAGPTPVEALVDVVARWTDALNQLGLPAWKIIRTEVFTPEDLHREFEDAERAYGLALAPQSHADAQQHDEVGSELLRRAFADPLTGLPGGEAFAHRLHVIVARAGAETSVAVVCLDLDDFEEINRLLGGAGGDHMLIAVAGRLERLLRPGDVLARVGADEYAILLEHTTEGGAAAVAERMLDTVRLPITISGQALTLSASVGVAVGRGGGDQDLLANARAAVEAAKAAGRGGSVFYGSHVSHPDQTRPDFVTAALQDRLAHLQIMQRAAVAANEADTLDQAAQLVMRQICAHLGCAIGHLWVSPAAGVGELVPTSLWHIADSRAFRKFKEATDELSIRPGRGLPGRVLAGGSPLWISELGTDTDFLRRQEAIAAGLESGFAFPVLVGREVVAVLEFFCRRRMEPTESVLEVLGGIGTQLGRVVERQRGAEALRRAAEQLRESEARQRDAQRLARLGSWHADLRTGERTWSEGMYELYAMDPRHPVRLGSILDTVHDDDRARAQAALVGLLETGEPTAEEIRIVRADGQVRWHRAKGSVIRDDDGVVVAIQGTSQDITEAKLVQEALVERERQLAEAQRAARLGWWQRDLSSGRLTWSEEMCRLWGLEPGQEITFEAFLERVEPEHRSRVLEAGARLRRTGEPVCQELRATVADGRQRWFRGDAHVIRNEAGTPVKLFGTAQDITEAKQLEQDLCNAKELYRRIIETAHEGIMTTDTQNVVTFVNARMAEIVGYSVQELVGMVATELMEEETAAGFPGRNKRRREGMREHYQAKLRAKNGGMVRILVSASPLLDEAGQYAGALAMVTDVTAVLEAEDILRSQSERMRTETDEDHLGENPAGR